MIKTCCFEKSSVYLVNQKYVNKFGPMQQLAIGGFGTL